jgi:hypothetical protein
MYSTCILHKYRHNKWLFFVYFPNQMFAMSKQAVSAAFTHRSLSVELETFSKWKKMLQGWPRKYYYAVPVFSSEKY